MSCCAPLQLSMTATPPPPTVPPPQWMLDRRSAIISPKPPPPAAPPPQWLLDRQSATIAPKPPPPAAPATAPATLTCSGNIHFFKPAGSENLSRFDAVLLGDSLGRAKKNNKKKTTKWYLNEVVDELFDYRAASVCAAAIPGCTLGHPLDNYRELIKAAPAAGTCVLEISGNDFVGHGKFLEGPDLLQAVRELRPVLLSKYSKALVVLVGNETSWQYNNYTNAGLFDRRMDALAEAFQANGIPALRSIDALLGAEIIDSVGHLLHSDANIAIAKSAWRSWYEEAAAVNDFDPVSTDEQMEEARKDARREARKKRITRASMILSESDACVYCDACMEWRNANGFGSHHCCSHGTCRDIDRIICFAASQITNNAEAWALYAKHSRIQDFIVASAPKSLRVRLMNTQRGKTCRMDP